MVETRLLYWLLVVKKLFDAAFIPPVGLFSHVTMPLDDHISWVNGGGLPILIFQ